MDFSTEEERPARLQKIEHELRLTFAELMTGLIHEEVRHRCSGCDILHPYTLEVYDHPSQTKHDVCLWMTPRERIDSCWDAAMKKLDLTDVTLLWMERLQNMTPQAHFGEYCKWSSKDYLLGTWLDDEETLNEIKQLVLFAY